MNTKERQEFLAWYNQLTNEDFVFDFEQEIGEYCHNDVDILRQCCLKFKELIEKSCDLCVRPFQVLCNHCVRLQPSVRQQFLSEKTIGLNPLENILLWPSNGCHGFINRQAITFYMP